MGSSVSNVNGNNNDTPRYTPAPRNNGNNNGGSGTSGRSDFSYVDDKNKVVPFSSKPKAPGASDPGSSSDNPLYNPNPGSGTEPGNRNSDNKAPDGSNPLAPPGEGRNPSDPPQSPDRYSSDPTNPLQRPAAERFVGLGRRLADSASDRSGNPAGSDVGTPADREERRELTEKASLFGLGPEASRQEVTNHENLLTSARDQYDLALAPNTPDFEILNRMDVSRRRDEAVKLGLNLNYAPSDLELSRFRERKAAQDARGISFLS